jgi:hypothetical protein
MTWRPHGILLLAVLADLGPLAALAAYVLWCQQQPLFKDPRKLVCQ